MICKLRFLGTTSSSTSLARGQMGGGPFTYENVTGFERIAQELDGSLQQCGWPKETRERRMREDVMPQDHHLLPFSFSPASKAGERSWACASSRLWATRPTSCLSSQTRESLSSVRA